jgi:hypothetical protein
MRTANDEMCLIVQVETRAGLENLDAIRAVDGVDGVFFGAADLAASTGFVGEADHPDVAHRIEDGLRRVSANGKWGGVLCSNKALIRRYEEAGARFIAVGVDSLILFRATPQHLSPIARPRGAGPSDGTCLVECCNGTAYVIGYSDRDVDLTLPAIAAPNYPGKGRLDQPGTTTGAFAWAVTFTKPMPMASTIALGNCARSQVEESWRKARHVTSIRSMPRLPPMPSTPSQGIPTASVAPVTAI